VTTAPAIDEREHIEVFKAAINAALDNGGSGSLARCYGYDEVPGTKQDGSEDKVPGKLPRERVAEPAGCPARRCA
jgi:hypothetical protein